VCVLQHQCVGVYASVCVCVFVYMYILQVCMHVYTCVCVFAHVYVYMCISQATKWSSFLGVFLIHNPSLYMYVCIMCACIFQRVCVNGLAYIRMYNDAVLSSSGSCSTTSRRLDLNGQNIKSLAVGVFANMTSMT